MHKLKDWYSEDSIVNRIKDMYYKSFIFLAYRGIKYGLRNIVIWFPIVWKDRDWDYDFLLYVLHFKLKRMHKNFIDSKCVIEESDLVADQIQYAINIIEKIIEDSYEEYGADMKKTRQEDINNLFSHMAKHITRWWE